MSARRDLLRRRAELGREIARHVCEIADVDAKLADLEVDAVDEAGDPLYSTHRLPPDAKNADAFNRACRSGRVQGARKSESGRAWICTHAAWDSRAPAPRPAIAPNASRAKTLPHVSKAEAPSAVSEATLIALGAVPNRRSA